ncbi:ChaN family lipoprotein [Oricola sp.]|uniref:ChaN family lipoprotein n=1 Tax=Oricola sp. TaxID=1979950 RepID=UPI0025E7F8B8|nr:ChaN family lipoprotein [Oricola sp.]MCI5077841.1 ChaN family lipoprotein [Oricola sp.]
MTRLNHLRHTAIALLVMLPLSSASAADHPLVGTVWTGRGDPASFADIEHAAVQSDFVLIGEIHSNAEHHATQAKLVRAMAEAGRAPTIVFEMVPRGLQGALDAFLAQDAPDANALGEALQWETRGWPDWAIYQPIAEAALDAGLPMRSGDLDRDTIRAIARGADMPGDPVAYPEALGDRIGAEIMTAHCDLMPAEAIPPMVTVQQARDLSMADAMLASDEDGAVLIAGGGHTRTDWGVPFVLHAKAPDRSVLSIGQFEVTEEGTAFADYIDEGEASLPYDFVIFTTRSDDTDDCAKLREQMGK